MSLLSLLAFVEFRASFFIGGREERVRSYLAIMNSIGRRGGQTLPVGYASELSRRVEDRPPVTARWKRKEPLKLVQGLLAERQYSRMPVFFRFMAGILRHQLPKFKEEG